MFKAELAKKVISVSLAAAMLVVSPTIISGATAGNYNAGSSNGGTGSGSGGGEVVTPGGSGGCETVTGGSSSSSKSSSGSSSSSAAAVTVKESAFVVNSMGEKIVTTTVGAYSAATVKGLAVVTPGKEVNAAFGLNGREFAYIIARDSMKGPQAMEQAQKAAAAGGFEMGSVLDILLGKTANGEPVTFLQNVSGTARFVIGIPDGFAGAYDYAAIRVESGGAVTMLPDLDNDPMTLTFDTNASGLYAIVRGPAGCFDAYR